MKNILNEDLLQANTDMIYELAANFPDENFFAPAADGGWSCGEILQHLIAVERGVNYNLMGEWQKGELDPLAKAPIIKKLMEDPDTRYKAPDALQPNVQNQSKSDLLEQWLACRAVTMDVLTNFDLWPVMLSITHPALGHLTRAEWIYFLIMHAERHARQIRNLITGFPR